MSTCVHLYGVTIMEPKVIETTMETLEDSDAKDSSIVKKLMIKASEILPDALYTNREQLEMYGFKPELGGKCNITLCMEHRYGTMEITPKGREHLIPKDLKLIIVFEWRVWFGRWIRMKIV